MKTDHPICYPKGNSTKLIQLPISFKHCVRYILRLNDYLMVKTTEIKSAVNTILGNLVMLLIHGNGYAFNKLNLLMV